MADSWLLFCGAKPMPLIYKETSAPAAEPVTLALAHSQLVLDVNFVLDDPLITGLITAARQYVERVTQRAIFDRTMKLWLDWFPFLIPSGTFNPNDRDTFYHRGWQPAPIRLPFPRAVSVESITYVDANNVTQTLDPSTYSVAINSEPARIVPIAGYWPVTNLNTLENVCISYTTGTYGDGVTVNRCPMTIVQAMLLLISYWYSNRDAAASTPPKEIDLGVRALLAGETFDTFGF
jgi:hypothetical protein